MPTSPASAEHEPAPATKWAELMVFFILAVMIWPFVAIAIVGGYGFAVWIVQMILGPPGPPA